MNKPLHVADSEFEEIVMNSDLPVVVDFWAPWCGPCRMVAPVLDKIAKEYDDRLVVAKVNTDESNEWAGKFGIRGIPTMLFIYKGELVHTQVGALPEQLFKNVLDQFLEGIPSVSQSAR